MTTKHLKAVWNVNNKKGTSLLELIIGMAIMALIFGGVSAILNVSLKAQTANMSRGSDLQDANKALNRIVEELQFAYSDKININASATGAQASATMAGYSLPVTTTELYIVRGVDDGSGSLSKEERHIYLQNKIIVVDYAIWPQNVKPWPNGNITKSLKLTAASVNSLTMKLEDLGADGDITGDLRQRRKKITITAVLDSNVSTTNTPVTLTTQVITSNLF